MQYVFLGAIFLVLFSCSKNLKNKDIVEYINGRQLLTVNKISRHGDKLNGLKVNKTEPDSVLIDDEFLAKIFISDTDQTIADAFVDCADVDNASVDTITYSVSGCKKGLVVKSDTILIAFRPASAGTKTFPKITILTKDKENVFRTLKYTFDYRVVRKY